MEIGNYNVLEVKRRSENGLYLVDEDDIEVLLPKKFVIPAMKEGTKGKLFVYKDSEDRLTATTQKPLLVVGEVGYLTVKEIAPIGAFLDWGLDKDLLLPYSEQLAHVRAGEWIMVYVFLDRATERVVASTNLNKFIKNREVEYEFNDEVDLLIGDETEIGYRVVVDKRHWGMLYKSEIFERIATGQFLKGFVKKVREDGKVDVALQKQGIGAAKELTEVILEWMKLNKGILPLSDTSTPEAIHSVLGISKKNFKKAIGMLFKKGLIDIGEKNIRIRS